MWWTPLGFFGPLTIIFFVLICIAAMSVIMRMMHRRDGRSVWGSMMSCCGGAHAQTHIAVPDRAIWPGSTPNSAFQEYAAETLRRLEQDQGEFQEFLDRLRKAKDQAEFDKIMTERRAKAVEA